MPVPGSIWHNPTSKVPTSDSQIVRVNMEEQEIGGRKSHLPGNARSSDMNVTHVSGNGTNGGR